MQRLEQAGKCVFCEPDADAVIVETIGWRVIRNLWPYQGTGVHLLLLPVRHITDLNDLTTDEWSNFGETLAKSRDICGLNAPDASLGLAVRSGDPAETGATVRHLHFHLIHGDHADPNHQEVRMKLSTGAPRPPTS